MTHFADHLADKVCQTGNPTVLGLDPVLEYIPDSIIDYFKDQCGDAGLASGLALYEFNRRLIDSTADLIPAVKLQLAYYEQYGPHGLEALRQTIQYAHKKDMLVIADAKRNDIGSTAGAYAKAYLGSARLIDGTEQAAFDADAITVNAYLGLDGVRPFLDFCGEAGKGVFILVRTSNPSAGDLQDLILSDGRTVFEAMADHVAAWGKPYIGESGYSSVGAVVGATWPLQAARLRRLMPQTLILVPGYGAQGASADDAVCSFGPDGGGALVNASRSMMNAWKKHNLPIEQFDLAARQEAISMKNDLRQALERRAASSV
ncbi:MAG: orotidine-5'-phosphate decarboxylase [Clostridiaceae bacterium]|nr:orotidine-5'-phosphate decarboxylase [Clostridiaceae bacterium]